MLDKILETINEGKNIILHGCGGVGKSYLIEKITKELEDEKIIFVTATTGIAALNVNGTTLHSFSGLKPDINDVDSMVKKIKKKRDVVKRWKTVDILIIDEISMLGVKTFIMLNSISQVIRKNKNPMGGIQVIFSGDFLQLPPVKDDFIFTCKEWNSLDIHPFILEKPYRYDDMNFFNMLMRIRKGICTDEDNKCLEKRVKCAKNYYARLENVTSQENLIKPTIFLSKRNQVDEYNISELEKLKNKEIIFEADEDVYEVEDVEYSEDYSENEEIDSRNAGFKLLREELPNKLVFKKGAQVMLKVNLDIENGLVNGSRGVITDIYPYAVYVKFISNKNTIVPIYPYKREIKTKGSIISRSQIPLILAFAMTIHHSQGSTLDYATIDLGNSIFAEGQAYVALSRCRSIRNLFITEYTKSSIAANKVALDFVKKLEYKAKHGHDMLTRVEMMDIIKNQKIEIEMLKEKLKKIKT